MNTASQAQQPEPQPTSTKQYAMHTAAGAELQAAAEQVRYSVQQLLAINPASTGAEQAPQQPHVPVPSESQPQLQPPQPNLPSQAQMARPEIIGGEEVTPLPRSGDAPRESKLIGAPRLLAFCCRYCTVCPCALLAQAVADWLFLL